MTATHEIETLTCVACGQEHPRRLSVKVMSTGLSCGLACMTPEQRRLFGLPEPDDAAIGVFPAPPYIQGWEDKPSRYFNVSTNEITTSEQPQAGPEITAEHFRRALNLCGLPNVLRAVYGTPQTTITVDIQGTPVLFAFRAYTAAQRLHIWADALTSEDPPTLLRGARFSWTDAPDKPEQQQANRAAVQFVQQQDQERDQALKTEQAGINPNTPTNS